MASFKKHVFTPLDKIIFKGIYRKYLHIIENKKVDSGTLKAKNLAWMKVTSEYNSSPPVRLKATSRQLRRLWMNLKQRRKKAPASEERSSISSSPGIDESNQIWIEENDLDTTLASPNDNGKHQIETAPVTTTETIPPHNHFPKPEPPLSPPISSSTTNEDSNQVKNSLLKYSEDRNRRINEIHDLQVLLMKERIREAKAKADLAQLLFEQQHMV